MRPWPLLLALALGCDSNSPSASKDAAPTKTTPTAAPPTSAEQFPPTGMYEITARVVSDTCAPTWTPPAPWRSFVQSAAEKGIAKVNLGLAAVPPSNQPTPAARSDFRIQPREPTHHTFSPPDCAGYTAERTFEITAANKDGFTLAITVAHGAPGTCAPTFPANCTTSIEQSFRVVEPMCRAECFRGAKLADPSVTDVAAQKWDVDCRCE